MTLGEQYLPVIVERIVREFDPLRVIVFGSHARGDAAFDSDLDLLIVLRKMGNKREKAVAIGGALSDLPVPKDIIVTDPEEIERRGELVGDILRPALREGRIVYEKG